MGEFAIRKPRRDRLLRLFRTMLLLLFIACGSSDPVGSALQAPWGALNLPIEDGLVEEVTATDLHLVYDDSDSASVDRIATRFGNTLEGAGWKMLDARKMGPMSEIRFSKDKSQLRMILSRSGKRVDIQVEFK